MRRGLMAWDGEELPASVLAERLARLQGAMAAHNLDAMVIYTNFPRPSAVAWITAFTPYWADALLYVPRQGEPVFATALSKRVAKWINSVKPVGELVNTMRPGKIVGERLAAAGIAKRIGVLDIDALPNGLYEDIAEAMPQAEMVEAGPAFAQARRVIDAAERGLLVKVNAIASTALSQAAAHAKDVGTIVGEVERAARLAGAEEAYVHIAPDLSAHANLVRLSGALSLGARFALRVSVAYKGLWVRQVKTFSADAADAAADAWLADTLASLTSERSIGAQVARPELQSFTAESCIGSYPLEAVASSALDAKAPEGSLAVVTVKLALPHGVWIGGGPAIVGQGTAALLAA